MDFVWALLGALAALAGTRAIAVWGALPAARFTMIGSLLADCGCAVGLRTVCQQKCQASRKYENSHFPCGFQRVVGVDRRAGITRVLAEVLGMTASAACALPAPRLMLSNVMLIASSIALALGIALWTLPELAKAGVCSGAARKRCGCSMA